MVHPSKPVRTPAPLLAYPFPVTPAELSRTVQGAVRRAVEARELAVAVPERVIIERPRGPRQGDFATSVALRLARPAHRPPRQVAEILAGRLASHPGIARVDVAGPGFLNITLDPSAYAGLVHTVLAGGPRYGHSDALAGTRTTLTHAGECRAAVVAEAGNRLLRACGATEGPGEPVRVRAVRATYGELLRRLGRDATHWALLRPPAEDAPRLDAATLLAQRESNPLFRVRYAHARTRALLRNAHDLGFGLSGTPGATSAPAVPPESPGHPHPAETSLLGLLADHPRVVETAARHRAPDRVARHLESVAEAYFRVHDTWPALPRGDEKPSAAHVARLRLAEATGIVLAGGLNLLGISAPDHL